MLSIVHILENQFLANVGPMEKVYYCSGSSVVRSKYGFFIEELGLIEKAVFF